MHATLYCQGIRVRDLSRTLFSINTILCTGRTIVKLLPGTIASSPVTDPVINAGTMYNNVYPHRRPLEFIETGTLEPLSKTLNGSQCVEMLTVVYLKFARVVSSHFGHCNIFHGRFGHPIWNPDAYVDVTDCNLSEGFLESCVPSWGQSRWYLSHITCKGSDRPSTLTTPWTPGDGTLWCTSSWLLHLGIDVKEFVKPVSNMYNVQWHFSINVALCSMFCPHMKKVRRHSSPQLRHRLTY